VHSLIRAGWMMQAQERVLELLKDRSSQKGSLKPFMNWFRYPALRFLVINAGRLSQSDADDVFQETIIKIFKSIDQP
jgi:hypothetical protein